MCDGMHGGMHGEMQGEILVIFHLGYAANRSVDSFHILVWFAILFLLGYATNQNVYCYL
jgi:hypothetical protein